MKVIVPIIYLAILILQIAALWKVFGKAGVGEHYSLLQYLCSSADWWKTRLVAAAYAHSSGTNRDLHPCECGCCQQFWQGHRFCNRAYLSTDYLFPNISF